MKFGEEFKKERVNYLGAGVLTGGGTALAIAAATGLAATGFGLPIALVGIGAGYFLSDQIYGHELERRSALEKVEMPTTLAESSDGFAGKETTWKMLGSWLGGAAGLALGIAVIVAAPVAVPALVGMSVILGLGVGVAMIGSEIAERMHERQLVEHIQHEAALIEGNKKVVSERLGRQAEKQQDIAEGVFPDHVQKKAFRLPKEADTRLSEESEKKAVPTLESPG